jgi:hypothetical protein
VVIYITQEHYLIDVAHSLFHDSTSKGASAVCISRVAASNCHYFPSQGIGNFAVRLSCKGTINKLRGISPRANHTDRATAACREKLVPTFADRRRHVVSVMDYNIFVKVWRELVHW